MFHSSLGLSATGFLKAARHKPAVTAGSSTELSHCRSYKPISSNMGRELINKSVLKVKQTQETRQDNTTSLSTVGFKNRLVNLSAMLQA